MADRLRQASAGPGGVADLQVPAPGPPRIGPWPLLLVVVALVCAVFVVATTLQMVWDNWTSIPFWDHWEELVHARGWSWTWLASQHNEHRILFPRLVFLADAEFFGERPVVSSVLIVACLAVLAATLARVASIDLMPDRALVLWAWGMAATLLFFARQYENLLWAFQVQFVGVLALSALSLAVVSVGPATLTGALWGVLLSGMAAFTLASGISVPFFALVLAAWTGKPRFYLAVLATAAVAWPLLYLNGYVKPPQTSNPLDSLLRIPELLQFFVLEMGSPLELSYGFKRRIVCLVAGLGMLVLYLAALWLARRDPTPARKMLVVFSLTVLAGAGLTALGRVSLGADSAIASRYASPMLAVWVTTALLLTMSLPRKRRWQGAVLTLPLLLGVAFMQVPEVRTGGTWQQARMVALPALLTGTDDETLLRTYFERRRPLEEAAKLWEAGTSLFSEPVNRLFGKALAETVSILPAGCAGTALAPSVVTTLPGGWHLVGPSRPRPLSGRPDLVFTDAAGMVVGYGVDGLSRKAVDPHNVLPPAVAYWVASIRGPPSLDGVRAYVLRDRGTKACLVALTTR